MADAILARLSQAKALLVGAGGLGSPAALGLAAAGVGTLGLVDGDVVDLSNLQRQVLYRTSEVGRPKVEVAAARLGRLHPELKLVTYRERLTAGNARELFRAYDVVLDGSDNFPTRYLCNDAAVLERKPVVHGSIFRYDGQLSVFYPGRGPCYRCLFPAPPPPGAVPSCAEAGVLGVLPGLVGSLMAVEAIKLLLDEPALIGRLVIYNSLAMEFSEVRLAADPHCPVCGQRPTVTELMDYEAFCGLAPGGEVRP